MKYMISEPHLTISPKCCLFFWTSRLCGVACLVQFLCSMALFLELLHALNGKIWVNMAEPWTSVILSPWKIKTCPWKVLEFWFDKAVWTLSMLLSCKPRPSTCVGLSVAMRMVGWLYNKVYMYLTLNRFSVLLMAKRYVQLSRCIWEMQMNVWYSVTSMRSLC